ncbi:MAG: CotH kinase family protein [Sphaerochaeta sp.]
MKKKTIFKIFGTLCCFLFLLSCSKDNAITDVDRSIEDDDSVYEGINDTEVKELYVTVLNTEGSSKKYDYTLQQVNDNYTGLSGDEEPVVRVIFQEGQNGVVEKGNYGYGITDYNGTMELRGQSSRLAELKSYKIELNKRALWDGYQVVNLNKHPFDDIRIRNKLSFDLIKDIPNITSLKTQFIHLFVKDYSQGDYSQPYVDYGLYTQSERIDRDYLENHGLDRAGNLYKAENFEFYRYEDTLRLEDDIDYNEKDFEDILEIKNGTDHSKLLNMLDDVNNKYVHINTVIDKHFDRENLLTWMAINILTDNIDTASRNYFLYSPSDSDIWYFLPWDYDKGLGAYSDNRGLWQKGVSNYFGNVLIRRFLENKENFQDLSKKVDEVYEIMGHDKVEKLVNSYEPIALEYLQREPDNLGGFVDIEEVKEEFAKLPDEVDENYREYYESIEKPMPVFIGDPFVYGNYIQFTWSDSYDFQGDEISYTLEVSDSVEFDNIIYSKSNIKDTELIIDKLPPGHYYCRVFIDDSAGNRMGAFDIYIDIKNNIYGYGMKDFYINI